MKKPSIITSLLLISFALLTGCETVHSGPQQQRGAAYGTVIGAGAGGVIGHQSGRAIEGAAIGAVLGQVVGGQIGRAQDIERERAYQEYLRREREAAINRGASATDREIWEAEERARQAEARVAQVEAEQRAALDRARRLEEAERREREARRRLEGY